MDGSGFVGRIHVSLNSPPGNRYMGMGYEQASRTALELASEAVRTGKTLMLREHLNALYEQSAIARTFGG